MTAMTDEDLAIWKRAQERPLLYVAGPMTSHGHAYSNVRDGIMAGQEAFRRGWAPIVPHLSALWEMVTGETGHSRWIELDFAYIDTASALLFLPNWDKSRGALSERRLAFYLSKPRFYGLDNLPSAEKWLDSLGQPE